jgi:hypothetical protein
MMYIPGVPVAVDSHANVVAVWVYNAQDLTDTRVYELNCSSEEAAESLVEAWRVAFQLRPPSESFTAGLLRQDIRILAAKR